MGCSVALLRVWAGVALAAQAGAQPVVVGWSDARGGPAGSLLTGSIFAELRGDLGTVIEPATLRAGTTITPQLLQGATVAVFTAVWRNDNIPITPLTPAEQSALVQWMQTGGRVIILTDNPVGYGTASTSLVQPFGIVNTTASNPGLQSAFSVLTNICAGNDGPFGQSTEIRGDWTGSLAFSVSGASPIFYWKANNGVAMGFVVEGAGRGIICSDASVIDSTVGGGWAANAIFRRNMLAAFAGLRIRVQSTTQPACAGGTLTLSLPAGVSMSSYRWRKNGVNLSNGGGVSGASSPTLTISGVTASDAGVYDCVLTGTCGNGPATFTTAPWTVSVCEANCDCSTTAPILNALDLSCFLNRYAAGDPYANCDASTVAPVLNALDFSCFLGRYVQGCP